MGVIDNAAERVFPAGQFASGNFDLPIGARELLLILTTDTWPEVDNSDTISIALLVSRNQGPFVQEWASPPFMYKALYRHGVRQPTLTFGAALGAAFGASDRVRYEFTSTGSFRSAVTIEANIVTNVVQG